MKIKMLNGQKKYLFKSACGWLPVQLRIAPLIRHVTRCLVDAKQYGSTEVCVAGLI